MTDPEKGACIDRFVRRVRRGRVARWELPSFEAGQCVPSSCPTARLDPPGSSSEAVCISILSLFVTTLTMRGLAGEGCEHASKQESNARAMSAGDARPARAGGIVRRAARRRRAYLGAAAPLGAECVRRGATTRFCQAACLSSLYVRASYESYKLAT